MTAGRRAPAPRARCAEPRQGWRRTSFPSARTPVETLVEAASRRRRPRSARWRRRLLAPPRSAASMNRGGGVDADRETLGARRAAASCCVVSPNPQPMSSTRSPAGGGCKRIAASPWEVRPATTRCRNWTNRSNRGPSQASIASALVVAGCGVWLTEGCSRLGGQLSRMPAVHAEVEVVDDPAGPAERLAAASGHVALAGGSTPRGAYERAAALRDWSGATFWFGDERCVPPDHEHSNYGMARSALLDRIEGADGAPDRGRARAPRARPRLRTASCGEAFGDGCRPRPDAARAGPRRPHCPRCSPSDAALGERERRSSGSRRPAWRRWCPA